MTIVYGEPVGPIGLIPDNRTVQNSGVGLTEPPPMTRTLKPDAEAKALDQPGMGMLATVAINPVQGYPGGHQSTHYDARWNKVTTFGKK